MILACEKSKGKARRGLRVLPSAGVIRSQIIVCDEPRRFRGWIVPQDGAATMATATSGFVAVFMR